MIEWLGTTAFSFLEGTSLPQDLVTRADELGYAGLSVADRMGFYGVVRAYSGTQAVNEARAAAGRPPFLFAAGIRLHFDQADPLFVYPRHRAAHGDLCRWLSSWALAGGQMDVPTASKATNRDPPVREKGLTPLGWRDFLVFLRARESVVGDFLLISASGRFYPWVTDPDLREDTRIKTQDEREAEPSFCVPPTQKGVTPFWLLELTELCGRGASSALSLAYPINLAPGVPELQDWLEEQATALDLPLLATSFPLYADKSDQDLCDLVAAIRHGRLLDRLGYLSQANGERRLLPADELARRKRLVRARLAKLSGKIPADPFEHGFRLRERIAFSLAELRYRYPSENIPAGRTPALWLRELSYQGAEGRYPDGIPDKVRKQLDHELTLISQLNYEDYFLTVWQVLEYAREQKILFQGRGSAANSAVCYCLGITSVDPVQSDLLFERFLSLERHEPPDIDVDFEHERREEVIQEVYRRYGRRHAAMVCSVIHFRGRMAVRETAKTLGFDAEEIDRLVRFMGREGLARLTEVEAEKTARKKSSVRMIRLCRLAPRLKGLPRHIGLHTGGFVLSHEALDEQCVLEPARMENRSIVPWDKDDVDALGWMKVDLLSLGMLTAIRKSFALIGERNVTAKPLEIHTVPAEDPVVYDALCRADTVGVFQIESRAQMNMLPRLAPRCFYDLVIEVAIVRPGPLQGGMVHPYLRRRQGLEKWDYEHPALKTILEKTHGVPIFQEQVMKIAVAVAGFTPGEADQMRKVMSGAWRLKTSMNSLREKLFTGMRASKIREDYIERLYRQIEGFGEYGFPESHAASFAKLTYVSSWLKVHHPAEFLCALLNSLPMGFYSAASLVGDAERHGVRVNPVDVFHSRWDSTLEANPVRPGVPHVRLGLRVIDGLPRTEAARIVELQQSGLLAPTRDKATRPTLADLRALQVPQGTLEKLVRAGACRGLTDAVADPRSGQSWELLNLRGQNPAAPPLPFEKSEALFLPKVSEWESILRDYSATGLSTGRHPVTFARKNFFPDARWVTAEDVYTQPAGREIRVLGLLTIKQKPPTAGGMCFLTLEDETGFFNLALRPEEYEQFRLLIQTGCLLAAQARVEKSALLNPSDPRTAAVSLLVRKLWNPGLAATTGLQSKPRDFH